MTYEPYILWACLACGANGSLSRPPAEDSLVTAHRIREAHAAADAQCDRVYGTSRISLHQEAATLPE
jgi:hypothetical protein